MNDASASARAAFRWGTTPEAADARRAMAERVGLYARLLASVFGAMYVFGALVNVLVAPELFLVVHTHPAKWINLTLFLVSVLCWRLMRRPELAESGVLLADAALPITVSLLSAAALPSAPHGFGLQFVPIMI